MPPIRSRASAAPASSGRTRESNPAQTTTSASPPQIACVKIQPADAPTRVERLPGGYVPNRPSNAWILYRARRVAQDRGHGGQQQNLSKAYSADWKALSADGKKPFYDVYRADDDLFNLRFPHYQYRKGARTEWEQQAVKYGIKVAHDWSSENDHLFVVDENGAVVHTPSVIPVTDVPWTTTKTLFNPSTRTPFLYFPPPLFQSWFSDADSPASTFTEEASPFHTYDSPVGYDGLPHLQVVEYASGDDDHRLVPSACLLYQDYNEPATKPEFSARFELVPSEDPLAVDITALQFNSLHGYAPGEMPTDPYDSEYYQPPGCASLWMLQYYHAE
ncbi:hypothetical protein BDZ89DRAFT_1160452 [Hymenopellis radicata]|nr:hypothetical protein BDZ89DRAFT_1160452 [Hymenopellis radicata]